MCGWSNTDLFMCGWYNTDLLMCGWSNTDLMMCCWTNTDQLMGGLSNSHLLMCEWSNTNLPSGLIKYVTCVIKEKHRLSSIQKSTCHPKLLYECILIFSILN